jgi:hypothetical protein
VRHVNSDLKIAGGVLPKTYFLRIEQKNALVLNFVHVFYILDEKD